MGDARAAAGPALVQGAPVLMWLPLPRCCASPVPTAARSLSSCSECSHISARGGLQQSTNIHRSLPLSGSRQACVRKAGATPSGFQHANMLLLAGNVGKQQLCEHLADRIPHSSLPKHKMHTGRRILSSQRETCSAGLCCGGCCSPPHLPSRASAAAWPSCNTPCRLARLSSAPPSREISCGCWPGPLPVSP